MILPLKTDRPLARPTKLVYTIIAINLVVHLVLEMLSLNDSKAFEHTYQWGQVWSGRPWQTHWYTYVTSAFLHADFLHIVGNMLFLFVFGPNVEDRFGRVGFGVFYLLGAVLSGIGHTMSSSAPAIGASGAVASVTGAFLVLFPLTYVRVVFFLIIMGVTMIPAWWIIVFAILRDFIGLKVSDNVAHQAHIAGYVYGSGVAFILLGTRVLKREQYDLFSIFRQAQRRRALREATTNSRYTTRGAFKTEKERRREENGVSLKEQGLAEDRSRVAALISEGKLKDAAVAYKQLLANHTKSAAATTLSRQHQYDLANHLFLAGDYPTAAMAYQRFIDGHPADRELNAARHLLARLYKNYLGKESEAKMLLEHIVKDLHDCPERDAAQQDLDTL